MLAYAASASAQTAQWVKQMGTGGISNGVSSDAAGNAYATGTVSNPGLFDSLNIPCNASDVFLAKYDGSGNVLWATIGGGALLDQGNDVVTDPSGNSYVVGAIQTNAPNPTAKFGSFTLVGNGDYDWLIVKYDTLRQCPLGQELRQHCGRHGARRGHRCGGQRLRLGFLQRNDDRPECHAHQPRTLRHLPRET